MNNKANDKSAKDESRIATRVNYQVVSKNSKLQIIKEDSIMKTKTLLLMVLILGLMLAFAAPHGLSQTRPEYIPLGGGVKGVLYRPDSNPSPQVAVIIIHRTANYLQHAGCTQLSQRGLMVLCMNSRFDNNEALVNWELIALDVKRGVDYLRNTQKISKVILF